MSYHVYTLTDPRTEVVYYVGMTIQPEVRYQGHLTCNGHDGNSEKYAWVRQLQSESVQPRMSILETVDDEQLARDRERYWIRMYSEQGMPLVNKRGIPCPPHKQEVKEPSNQILDSRYGDAYYPLEFILHPLYLDDEWEKCQEEHGYPKEHLETILGAFYLSFCIMHPLIGDQGMDHIEEWYKRKLASLRD